MDRTNLAEEAEEALALEDIARRLRELLVDIDRRRLALAHPEAA